MAEAIVNARYPDWKAYSAGIKPAGYIHELAIEALSEIGITHSGESKHINDLPTKDFDLVVTVCDTAWRNVRSGLEKRADASIMDL